MEKFGHDVLDRQAQICISSGECKTVLPPACVRAHPPCSISAHLAHSLRINCIPAKERARWGAGGRFSPFVGLVLLQGESFEIVPPGLHFIDPPLLTTFLGLKLASSVSCNAAWCWYKPNVCRYTNK